jgi:hypothetical protein
MVYMFMDNGFNFFDTAYMYNNSEDMLKKELVGRHPRSSYLLCNKIPPWLTRDTGGSNKLLQESLQRCGLDYFDFYLLHFLDKKNTKRAESVGLFEWMAEQKRKGVCRHIGFSFHGDSPLLDYILTKYPFMEIIMLQLNYVDILRGKAGELHQIALDHNKPILVMEPVKGGTLANLPPSAESLTCGKSPASYALRFAASLPGVTCVFSGMSNLQQMQDNIKTFKPFNPLDQNEYETINNILGEISKTSSIPCTGCNYCLPDCPKQIDISICFSLYNESKRIPEAGWNRKMIYQNLPKKKRAEACNSCGACLDKCPQKIDIPAGMKEIASAFK